MPRLHLKRTPAELEERARKKAKKAARKESEAARSKRSWASDDDADADDVKRHRARARSASPRRGTSAYHKQGDPGPSSSRNDYDHLEDEDEAARAQAEEERFAEKMRDALDDDTRFDPMQRLDGVEARLNSYAHLPRRWRGTDEGFSAGLWMEDAREEIGLEPWQMNDDEYAEYIRAGIWRKKNGAEYQERLLKKEEREARKARERRIREETRRLEREAQAEYEAISAARAKRRVEEAKQRYEERWAKLLERPAEGHEPSSAASLHFDDIPWPIAPPPKSKKRFVLSVDAFTKEAVSSFLLPSSKEVPADAKPGAKDNLRSTMLKFHPDKFESRVLVRVREKDREIVKEMANMVVRILNELSKENR